MSPQDVGTIQDQVHADLEFLSNLVVGFGRVLCLQALLGLVVFCIGVAFPSQKWRQMRVGAGVLAVAAAWTAGRKIFDPNVCYIGASGSATLLIFNAPLRCVQFLMTPLQTTALLRGESCAAAVDRFEGSRSPCSNGASGHSRGSEALCEAKGNMIPSNSLRRQGFSFSSLLVTVLLVVFPATPILPGLSLMFERTVKQKPISPVGAFASAISSFCLSAAALYIAPSHIVATSLFVAATVTFMTSGFTNLTSSLFAMLSGVPISAPFTYPWFAVTLSSFWAWRWNAAIAGALRSGIYEPLIVYEGASSFVGTQACFLVSGVAHGYILWSGGFDPLSATMWCLFFVVHGLLVCLERFLIVRYREHVASVPPLGRRLITLVCFLATAHFLFLLPLIRHERFHKIQYELSLGGRLVGNMLRLCWNGERILSISESSP